MNKYYLRAGILALAASVLPGCLEVPPFRDLSDAGTKDTGGISDTTSSGDEPDTGNGLDARVEHDAPTGRDAGEDTGPGSDAQFDTEPDTQSGDDANQGDVDAPEPCYRNSFDTIASLSQFVAQSGRWNIHPDGYLQQTQIGGGPQGVGYFDIGHFVNSQVRLRVRIPQQETGSVFAQLLFRYTRQSREGYDDTLDHGYTLQIEGNERFSVEDFYQRRLATAEVNAAFGEWHDLMLQVLGDQIVGFLGGEEIIRFTDGTYIGGKIGLSTHAGMVDFDDLEICPLERIINPAAADASCVALYHFDEPNPYRNECIQAHTLTDDRGTQSTRGRFRDGRAFNGNAYLLSSGNITLDLDRLITVETWIKPDRAQESYNGTFGNLVHSAYNNGPYEGFAFGINNEGLWFVAGVNGVRTALNGPTVLPTDRFTNVAATYDGNHLRLYVDGVQVNEQASPGRLTRITDPSAVLTLGADRNGLNGFMGAMDEVRISSVVRY